MQKITIVGAGTMGNGIAHISALANYKTILTDLSQAQLEKAHANIMQNLDKGIARGKVTLDEKQRVVDNLSLEIDLATAVQNADMVIEAIPENIDWKKDLLQRIDALTPEHTILASNTSSLSIAELANCVSNPSQVIGMHFFNPVHIMELLEIVFVPDCTSQEVIEMVQNYAKAVQKTSILVKNSPGFATSRLGIVLGMEAIRMLEEGVASAEDIDTAMVLGYRHPIGPLKLTDLVGLDVRLDIATYLEKELNSAAFTPPQLLKDMVANGQLGKKSKSGFYQW